MSGASLTSEARFVSCEQDDEVASQKIELSH
jgi:hypothetical protein